MFRPHTFQTHKALSSKEKVSVRTIRHLTHSSGLQARHWRHGEVNMEGKSNMVCPGEIQFCDCPIKKWKTTAVWLPFQLFPQETHSHYLIFVNVVNSLHYLSSHNKGVINMTISNIYWIFTICKALF